MSIDNIIQNNLNGEPIHDAVMTGAILIIIYALYKELFKAVFSVFK